MSTKQNQTKSKLSEVAKDLKISNQELCDFISDKFGTVKKPSASITQDELNYILESFSQNNQVDSFNPYFESRNNKPEPKKEEKPADKKPAPAKKQEKPAAKKDTAPKATQKAAAEPAKPAQPVQTAKPAAPKAEPKAEKPVEKKPEAPKNNNNNNEKMPLHKSEQKSALERFNNQVKKSDEKKNSAVKQEPKKPENKIADNNKTVKTKLGGNFSSESVKVEQKMRTVDTRGSYVDIDKYNEKYENIAPLSGGGSGKRSKDNLSKKQKLTQKSAQRNKQQYSSKKETEAEKLRRLELERARKQQLKVLIPDEIVVSELASRLKVTATEVIKKLMGLGEMCTINQVIDFDTASLVAEELGAKVEKEVIVTIEERLIDDSDDEGEGVERAPVVVVMGHVDHGKTSLLDRIRNSHVTDSEAGGITQHIGAYRVNYKGKDITFLDTPGHEAFTSMRARGASVTDIAILVVAADDGIMPQTVEAINHAKAAGVSIIVAINKMDKEGANPDNIKQQLTEYGLVCEEWGGDTIVCPISAKTGMGVDNLLEMLTLTAEVGELKANPHRAAQGTVIEARLDKGRGPVATLLVQNGTLHSGDVIIAGTAVGRVRTMRSDKGQLLTDAGPSTPVEITGLTAVPEAGDLFEAVEDERLARELAEQRIAAAKEKQFSSFQKVTLDNLFSQMAQNDMKELAIVVKADVQGSAEAVKQSLEKISNDEVRVRVIHAGVGAISKSDVDLADASNAIIIGFNVRPDNVAKEEAAATKVEMRMYRVIYDAINDVTDAMKGMLAPKFREVSLGELQVRQVYKISNVGTVAGCRVTSGKITRDSKVRVVRDGIVIAEDEIASLKRFKDDVKEVGTNFECGISLTNCNDIKVGDIIESYEEIEVKQTL